MCASAAASSIAVMRVAAAWWARVCFSQRTTWPLTSSTCRQNSSGRFRQTSTEIGSGWRFAVTAQS
jgi:hypothetical protein